VSVQREHPDPLARAMRHVGVVERRNAARGPTATQLAARSQIPRKRLESMKVSASSRRCPCTSCQSVDSRASVRPRIREARFGPRSPGRSRTRLLLAIQLSRCQCRVGNQPIQRSRLAHLSAAEAQPTRANQPPSTFGDLAQAAPYQSRESPVVVRTRTRETASPRGRETQGLHACRDRTTKLNKPRPRGSCGISVTWLDR